MPGRAVRTTLAALVMLAPVAAAADVPQIPDVTGRVVDGAGILRPDTRERLTTELAAHERATGNQVAVLTVATLGGEPVENFANRVFARWKLGQKGKDNGVLVVVASGDHRARIEVGYGLE